ncbi:alpha-L-rhamnosidase C-terminal domain-containing protein [uncultured Draconibacterium sp.]|uniref:alpha-L-rhamnosidase-related protein n=1 Tax=uncultured Draconibacterium sp. TaxID=1573823 RepID=UPI0025F2FDC7|nr:alpha-L-rhamnosidase C-terminal domain-containing protein [uncultured Draconibacterium sp.]
MVKKRSRISRMIIIFMLVTSAFYNKSYSQNSKFEFELDFIQPEKITKVGEGHYLIDFGKAFFGTVVLETKHEQDDSLILHIGEKVAENSLVDKQPGGTIRYQEVVLNMLQPGKTVVQLKADKRNTGPNAIALPDSFGVIMPFRYCELKNLKIPIREIDVLQKAFYCKFDDEASLFTSSDTVLNAVWELCKHTIKATTFTGYYVDGDRERIPYEADAYINQLSHYCLDKEYAVARRTNQYFLKHPTWPTEWLLHTVMLFYQDYMYTGDLQVLQENYETLKTRTLMELVREDGLISTKTEKLTPEYKQKLGFKNPKTNVRDIVDWPPGQKDTGWKLATEAGERDGYEMVAINTVVNAFYYHNMKLMAEIANFIGKYDDAKCFQEKAAKTKEAINQKLFDKERGVYVDGEHSNHASLHANMFPLAFDLVPEEYQKSVVEHIKTRGMACSVYGAQYLLEGLFKARAPEYAMHLITDTTHDRTWWNMIKIGSTMTLEAWDMKYKPNADWNHAWGTAPTNIVTRYMWGITPREPGFKSVTIKPQIVGLTHCKLSVPTKVGQILASFETMPNGKEKYTLVLPDTMRGEFYVPNSTEMLLFNGLEQKKWPKVVELKPGENIFVLKKI